MRKICVVTGTRAEYGLLQWLMRDIQADPELTLSIVATCMHLSPEFGLTYQLIEQDGFCIDEKVEMLLSSDTAVGVTKSMGLGLIGFAEAFARICPDCVILLGDRFETLAAAQAALMQNIPIGHIHGGELSEGAIDDAIRHAITKLSHVHFVAAESYRKRVVQLGEHPDRVFNVGAPGLERINRMSLLSKPALESALTFTFGQPTFLVTYHPATIHPDENAQAVNALFAALDAFSDAHVIFTKANADEAGRFINQRVEAYVQENANRMAFYTTMGDVNYLSALQYVDVVIGNSSSGLIEVPYFKKPTVNIGSRQNQRLKARSIIDCDVTPVNIQQAIEKAFSAEHQHIVQGETSPYGQGATASAIVNVLKSINFSQLVQKRFYDEGACESH